MKSVEEYSDPAVGTPADRSDLHAAGTRNRVARSILDHGPSTAVDLARRLDLTAAAVRRHLDCLVADGLVERRERRVIGSRGRGRPARVFALTDAGRTMFYQAYDELAVEAIRYIGTIGGPDAISAFARARVAALEERYRDAVAAAPPGERAHALAGALSADGYAASAKEFPAAGGEQLCQHHCPVVRAAERFPQLCEEETRVFSRLLGTHVQRLATIAHGDGVCTTFVPDPTATRRGSPPTPTTTALDPPQRPSRRRHRGAAPAEQHAPGIPAGAPGTPEAATGTPHQTAPEGSTA